jgi:hypothetical protein
MKAPIVIGALGGSGTRVVAWLVQRMGVYLGTNRNAVEDAMEFVEFYDRWINRFILREIAPFCHEEQDLMMRDFIASVARHRMGIPSFDTPWGWKEPRSHYLLPFFNERYRDMKFIHLVRDGRDMAFSSNQHQLRKHGPAILGPALLNEPQPVQTAALWAKINLSAAQYAESAMQGRYIMVRFEDLCIRPCETARVIADFLGCSIIDCDAIAAGVVTPESTGRWRRLEDPNLLAAIQFQAANALHKFGYSL